MKKLSQTGISMVEIMLATAMLGGLALAGMQLMKNQSEGQKTVEKKFETVTAASDMRSLLSDPDNCTETFRGLNPASGAPTKLRKKVAAAFEDVYVINTQLPGNIKVKSYVLDKTLPGMASNETALKINFDLGKAAIRDNATNILKISYNVDIATGLITDCTAISNNSDTFWLKSAINAHNIYYNGGSVGIGNVSPSEMLDVTGNGRFGGKIKLGGADTVVPCSTANEGEIRYETSSHRMLFCNGTKWTSMGGTLMRQAPTAMSCTGADIDTTYITCATDTYVRSCGIELTTVPADGVADTISCTVDPITNRCVGFLHRNGMTCDAGISLQCFCQ